MDKDLERRALEFYAEQVRNGSDELYYHYRLYEKYFMLAKPEDGDELLRRATMKIFTSDPFAYAGTFPFVIDHLDESDLEEIAQAITFGGDEGAAQLLRGHLWADAAGHGDHRAAFAERAVAELEAVPEELRSHEFWEKLARCYRKVDYEKFKSVIPTLFASGPAEWRASEIVGALEHAGGREDWPTYDEWRTEWDALPQNAHLCDCHLNTLATFDGLRALHRGDVSTAVERLTAATQVRGCAHLNTGAAELKLVEALLDHPELTSQCEAYLDFCDRMSDSENAAEKTAELRTRLRGSV
ncbi:MAG: hypothetical protein WD557_14440 [Dehalococcoidia bacterium]